MIARDAARVTFVFRNPVVHPEARMSHVGKSIAGRLGPTPIVEKVVVVWPDGKREEFAAPTVDSYSTLGKGKGL
jgi:hypothetical protein